MRKRLSGVPKDYWALLLLMLFSAAILATFAILRHERLNSSAFDLAIKSQVIWNTRNGNWFASSIEVSHYLGDHVQLIFLPLAPLLALWSDVKILLILQAILLSLAAIPVFRIAHRHLHDPSLSLLFALAYLLYPLVGFVNRFDFHPLVFSILLFLIAYDLLESEHPVWATIAVLFALTLREEVGFTVFAFGIYVAYFMKRPRLGLFWASAGLVWSLVAILIVIPTFRGGSSDTFGRYAWLGSSIPQILQSIFSRPTDIITHLAQPFRLLFLLKLFLPLGFLSLLAPAILLVGLPALAYNMLSETASQSSIYFQYMAPFVPFIFIAAILGAVRVQKHWGIRRARPILAVWLSLSILIAWIWDNPFTQKIDDPYFPVYALEQDISRHAFQEAASLLPPDAPLATTMAFAPHLSLRPDLQLFYDRLKLEQRAFGVPQSEYILLHLSDWRWGVNARFYLAGIETAIGRFGYEAIYFADDIVLLKKMEEPQSATGQVLTRTIDLFENGGKFSPAAEETINWLGRQWLADELPPNATKVSVEFEQGVTLAGYEMPSSAAAGDALCVTLYWSAAKPVEENYTVFLHLNTPDGFVAAQRDGEPAIGFLPTRYWPLDAYVTDMRCLQIPQNLAGTDVFLRTGLYDSASGKRLTHDMTLQSAPESILLDRLFVTGQNN